MTGPSDADFLVPCRFGFSLADFSQTQIYRFIEKTNLQLTYYIKFTYIVIYIIKRK